MKKVISVVSSLVTASLFAAVAPDADTITFSTVGPDTYADGETVKDGECYALVWSQNGDFDGISADGTPVDSADKVVYIGAFANGGKCPTVVFTIPEGCVPKNGVFDVYLLDTRRYAANGEVSVGKKDGKVAVNAAAKAATATVAASGSVDADTVVTSGVSASAATALPPNVPTPKIAGMTIDGDNVILKVENTVDYVNYATQESATIGGTTTVGDAQIGGGTIYLVSPKNASGSGFIKVIRK